MIRPRPIVIFLFIALLLGACGGDDPAPMPEGESAERARVTVTGSGLFELAAPALAAVGYGLEQPLTLSLAGEPVAMQRLGDSLFFFVPDGARSRYSPELVLWLEPGGDATPVAGEAPLADPTLEQVTIEQRLGEAAQWSPRHVGDPWFWKTLVAPGSEPLRIESPGRVAGVVEILVRVAGVTEVNHRIDLRVDGSSVGEVAWQGQARHEESFEVDLPAGESFEVELALPESERGASILMIDEIVLRYPGRPVALDGTLVVQGGPGGVARLEGMDRRALGWVTGDVLEPLPLAIERGSLRAALPAERPLVVVEARRAQPATVVAASPVELSTGADYIAVVPEPLQAALEPLLAYHRSQGLSTVVYTPQELYDQYTHGLVDPLAFRDLVADALANWDTRPRFLLLVGDSTYDPYGYLEAPDGGPNRLPEAYVPSPFIDTVFGGETVSDNVIADADGDGYPDIALGRLPARSAEQLATGVSKILGYVQNPSDGAWRRQVLFAADGREPLFRQNSEEIRATLTPGVESMSVYPDAEADAMAEIVPALNEGHLIVNYVGHGSVQQWGRDQLLDTDAAAGLTNGDRLPIFINMTCLTGLFSHPNQESLAETLLWSAQGGAVASVAPTSLTLPSNQSRLNQALLNELLGGERPTVGEALMKAKRQLPLNSDNDRDIVATFNLIGDPAMRPATVSP